MSRSCRSTSSSSSCVYACVSFVVVAVSCVCLIALLLAALLCAHTPYLKLLYEPCLAAGATHRGLAGLAGLLDGEQWESSSPKINTSTTAINVSRCSHAQKQFRDSRTLCRCWHLLVVVV